MTNQAIQRFIELDKKKEEVKQFFEQYKLAIEDLVKEIGVGGHFQDADGTVYLVEVPEGKFVAFDRYTVARTRRSHEKRGDLSLTKARDLGYSVE